VCAAALEYPNERGRERERERERAFVGGEEREPAQGETEVFELPKSSNLEPSKCVVLFY
jgi:hypothetical protein